jgi:hypothetical protein
MESIFFFAQIRWGTKETAKGKTHAGDSGSREWNIPCIAIFDPTWTLERAEHEPTGRVMKNTNWGFRKEGEKQKTKKKQNKKTTNPQTLLELLRIMVKI